MLESKLSIQYPAQDKVQRDGSEHNILVPPPKRGQAEIGHLIYPQKDRFLQREVLRNVKCIN